MVLGYSVNYPPGCKELSPSLKPDELRKRLNDLSNGFDKLIELEASCDDVAFESECPANSSQHDTFKGLALLLLSAEYTQYIDLDIRLRVGVCLCKLLKLFCPRNPFEGMLEEKSLTKEALVFLLSCIQRLSTLKNKGDVAYPKLHAIVYLCCQMDLFLWCASIEDEGVLFKCIQTTFSIVKNLSMWAWTEPSFIRQMLLDMIVKVVIHSENLLSHEIVTYLLEFLIEPAKSTQPEQHTFTRDLILRSSRHLEYIIQMLLQNALITGSEQQSESAAATGVAPSPDSQATGPHLDADQPECSSHDLGEHAFLVIYALHTIQDSIVSPLLPTLELKLKSPTSRDRKRSFRLLARLFSERNSLLYENNPTLWSAFLGRFNDIDKEVRKLCILMVPQMIKQNPDLPRQDLMQCVQQRAYDPEQDVRLLVLRTVAVLINDSPSDIADDLFELIKERSRDKDFSIRKEAATALASVYKHCVKADPLPSNRCTTALNTIMHMYYNPSLDDRIIVERLFKSALVPYHSSTIDRVRALFTFYNSVDEASIKATQELFKAQFTAISLLRDAVHFIAVHEGQKMPQAAESELIDRLQHLANLLPKADKSLEHLKRFFNQAHSDRALRTQLVKLTKPNCSCAQATASMRELLRRVDASSSTKSSGTDAHLNYVRSIKLLLERSAPVLFDIEFGQELVTQLVVVRDTGCVSGLAHPFDLARSLRLLYSLTVYFRKALPTDEVMDYLVGILAHDSVATSDDSSAKCFQFYSTNNAEQDPLTVQELSLYILCWLMGGSNVLSEGETQNQNRPVVRLSDSHFGGTEANLNERAGDLLPLLADLCCNGMTLHLPPIPYCSASETHSSLSNVGARQNKGKAGRGASKRNIDYTDPAPPINTDLYMTGLAWRRERRRAKLATQVLLCMRKLALRFRLNASKMGSLQPTVVLNRVDSNDEVDLDFDPTDTNAPIGADEVNVPSPLENAIQSTLDKVVQDCLSCPTHSVNYVACLTTLSRIALQLPHVYNREFKKLITRTLVQQVLAQDELPSDNRNNSSGTTGTVHLSTTEPKISSDWLHDGHIPMITRIKISAVKLMTNWLRGLKNEVKAVAQAVIRLLHRIIIHDGDLTRQGKLSAGEMSRMRLVAALSWLKLAHSQSYVENIEVDWYQSMSYIICDPCPQVRSRFLTKLNQGLYRLRLPLEYMAMFAHAADVPDTSFKQRAKQFLISNIQRRRDFLNRHPSYLKDAKFLYGLLPDFVLPYLIYLLAHDPEWSDPCDSNQLNRIKSSLWFVMEPVVTRGHNFVFLRKIIEKIKHTRDALAPDNTLMNTKLYITCDIALGLLLTRSSDLTIKEYPFDVKLPKALFCAAPSDFKNPDFAQLLTPTETLSSGTHGGESIGTRRPLIQFTPSKFTRSLKDALMPAELLKEKRQGVIPPKSSTVDIAPTKPSAPPNANDSSSSGVDGSTPPNAAVVTELAHVDPSDSATDVDAHCSRELTDFSPNIDPDSNAIPTNPSATSVRQSSADKRAQAVFVVPENEPESVNGFSGKRKQKLSPDLSSKDRKVPSRGRCSRAKVVPGTPSSPATLYAKKNVVTRRTSHGTRNNIRVTTVSRNTPLADDTVQKVKKKDSVKRGHATLRSPLSKSSANLSARKPSGPQKPTDSKRRKIEKPTAAKTGCKDSSQTSSSNPINTSYKRKRSAK